MEKLIQIHPDDNVLILTVATTQAEQLNWKGSLLSAPGGIGIGHKLAARNIAAGEHIIKYGVSIGTATVSIVAGAQVHLHNMKSDYIPTYTLENDFIHGSN